MDHGDWSGAVGALLLCVSNVLAIILLGVAVSTAARLLHDRPGVHRARPAYAVVVVASVIVTAALAVSTYRTRHLFDWQQSAKRVGTQWAKDHGEQLLGVRYDGTRSCSSSKAKPAAIRTRNC